MDIKEYIKAIGRNLRTQDNRATANPQFIVQQKIRFYGVGLDYTDLFKWIDSDNPEDVASDIEEHGLNFLDSEGLDTGSWRKVGYIEHWEFVTACFTEQGCEDYLRVNGHNLKEPRIYVESAYRNCEFNEVRELLKGLS